jgi:hypothetical protein
MAFHPKMARPPLTGAWERRWEGLSETTDGSLSSQAHGEADAQLSGTARARAAGLPKIWLISAHGATCVTVQITTFTERTALPLAASKNG